MTSSYTRPVPCQWFSRLAAGLDRRSAPRLALLFLGAVLARGRRTVTAWIRAAKLSGHYQRCYVAVAAAGKRADCIAWRLLTGVVRPLCNVRVLPDMLEAGLVSRKQDPDYAHAKPFFITEAGREYLEQHRDNPEMAAQAGRVAAAKAHRERENERVSERTFTLSPGLTVEVRGLPEPPKPKLKLWTGGEDMRRSQAKDDGPPDLPGR